MQAILVNPTPEPLLLGRDENDPIQNSVKFPRTSYRLDVINGAERTVREHKSVILGSLEEVPNEKVARQKLAVILTPLTMSNTSRRRR